MAKKLKIAVFHLAFAYSGGGEKLVIEEIRGLRERGHQVDCFVPLVDEKSCFPDLLPEIGVKEIIPGASRLFSSWPTLAIFLTCALMPLLAWRFRHYDVVFGANQPGPWFGYLINKFFQTPYVIYLAQPTRILYPRVIDKKLGLRLKTRLRFLPTLVNVLRPFIWWADSVSIKTAKVMFTNGEYIGEVLEKIYGREKSVCPAGCYPLPEKELQFKSRWQGSFQVKGKWIKKPYVLLTNRHSPQKRFEWAIKAMEEVWHQFPQIQLIITGQETSYTKSLKFKVKSLKLKRKVIFTGLVKEKDLNRLYQRAVVYAYTAPEEDFGMGMIEAMAHGVPVVAWNSAGPTVIVINGQTGFLAKPFEIGDFAQKIAQILGDKKLAKKMGTAGWTRANEDFSYQKHCQALEKAFLDAIKP